MKHIISAMIVALCVLQAPAGVKLPSLISHNMMLQQQTDARLWGKAKPGSKVTVQASWLDKEISAKAASDSTWQLRISTPAATKEPQTLRFSDGDGAPVEVSNILIGEVWYASGQSNMEMPVKGYPSQPVEGSLETILKAKKDRPIRVFNVPRRLAAVPQTDSPGHWSENSPAEVAEASATAYFFADYLNDMLDIPVGIVTAYWGGTRIQGWMPAELLQKNGFDVSLVGEGKPDPDSAKVPTSLFNGMASTVLPYTFKGMLWYQGEGNAIEPEVYARLFPQFVTDMRTRFENPDMPFYYVQIAPFVHYTDWGVPANRVANLRLAQSRLLSEVPNTGMVVTMDIGDAHKIHPENKKEVGRRLALWALAKDYGMNGFAYSGPVYKSSEIKDGSIYISFDNAAGGAAPYGINIEGFEIAGEDGVYHDALAEVNYVNGVVRVWSKDVPAPVKARYAFGQCPSGNLTDTFGLPASPFTTSGQFED